MATLLNIKVHTGNCRLIIKDYWIQSITIYMELHSLCCSSKFVHWSPLIQWFQINTVRSSIVTIVYRFLYSPLHHAPTSFLLLWFIAISLTLYYFCVLQNFHPGFTGVFFSIIVKADEIKSRFYLSHAFAPTAKSSIHAPLNWPISFLF